MTASTPAPTPAPVEDPATPLAGIRVIDLSTTAPGAMATQFLADAGAEVVHVEAPGGTPLRTTPGWPALARGSRSIVLDLHDDAGRARLDELLGSADVLVTTWRPQALAARGLDAATLADRHPRLISVAITGWGSTGPWAGLKGYEALVMAKVGAFHAKRHMVTRPGPAFVSVPYATWGAAQGAVHGVLSALLEREESGLGQHVEADLVRGVTTLDTWNWFTELIGIRWPGAYEVVDAFTPEGEPMGPMIYALLIAPTKDGHWLQFAQLEPRLFVALIKELGLEDLWTDPRWKGLPALPTQGVRGAPLSSDDPLCEEWDIVVLSPHFAAALIARECEGGEVRTGDERRFEFVLTYDRATVIRAAASLMSRVDGERANTASVPCEDEVDAA